ncbi:MAG: sulfotransferase [Actinomycetota bacterium]|nr:sulfotransferase [Actinomycetota bacterium]
MKKRWTRSAAKDANRAPVVVCDEPAAGAIVTHGTLVSGWAYSPAGIKEVSVRLDSRLVGRAEHGLERPDVAQAHPEWTNAVLTGFQYRFHADPAEPTTETLELGIVAVDGEGHRAELRRAVRAVSPPPPRASSRDVSKRWDTEEPLVEILTVRHADPDPEHLRGFSLDVPQPGTKTDVYNFELAGWVLGQRLPVVAVEVRAKGAVLRRVPLVHPRPDVAAHYPDAPAAERCGFHTGVGVLGLEPGIELQVRAVLEDESRVRMATVRLRHQPLCSGFEPTLQPLMLTTLGRAGTTWTMRVLSEHPKIVVHRWHPYELRIARYWMHNLKVLSEPKDPYGSAHADTFQTNKSQAGHNPFFPDPMSTTPGLAEWFGRTHVQELAAFCQRSAEECYQRIAASQGQEGAVYFAEKHRADYLPWLFWELYPRTKEVFLVRDFRDVVSSMLAFNAKQGRTVFGRPGQSDEEFARFIRKGTVRMISESWSKRCGRAHLIRYEDLIQNPEETLRGLLAYLDLDYDGATVQGMIDRATQDNPDMQRHRTSGEVSSSIGRWRQSLDPDLQGACREIFGDVLEQFGYEV